ncbi:metal ABC transporter permease [Pontibacter sp. BT310]|uniref:Metal ABC transporter permease n=1 Tax=Pontibacter populi TaxID=890055 RepID=A0ABS6XAB4_9BACT|nr:metal ABC transporter permease [Pontibacter populi]MBJ6117994.1 metal ABC transporter permease [Pontibacter sp. BT310]MBR0570421.1 metal ABC transporter permease [Microvirga sp. STS03]MBW3364847.1 metal ABC transporter permease [Pontibacter populi]
MNAFWIILTGSLVATCCSLLGCYLILRRMAMVGDAISHAVLPGIVIAFLFTGSRDSIPMIIGAGLLGVLTTFLIEFFHRYARVQADASIGITFTWLFAIGIILISVFAGQVDLDQDCVLYGEIAYVPLDLWLTENGLSFGPQTIWTLGFVTILIIAFITFGYKELFLTAFDPGYAAVIGISTTLWYYLLMTAVSLTTVASFESVGAILVVAFLVGPPATAYLLTDNFKTMLVLSVIIGIIASIVGYYLAYWLDGSIAGAIATVTGLQFALAFLFSPTHGQLFKRKRTIAV